MFFSVVIPSHKRKQLLQKTLLSLQKQTYKDFEVIVVATEGDSAYQLASEDWGFPLQITSIPQDPSQGRSPSMKRNFGAQCAKGQWIAFTDDDCVTQPQWLFEAHKKIHQTQVDFLEGGVEIPKPEKPNFTYKGLQRLARAGGYQTCNMFYKRKDFLELGGFDKNFPYYLEDTDLAWTFLDKGKKVDYCEEAKVEHPVPTPQPSKMVDNAWRMEKLPYLYKKHPKLFKESQFRVMPRPYFIFLVLDLGWLVTGVLNPPIASLFVLGRLFVTLLVLLRMLRGCYFEWAEFFALYAFLLICPWISLYSLIKGNLRQGVCLFLR